MLRDIFTLLFAPEHDPSRDGVPSDCARGNVRRCYPILAVWIADYIERNWFAWNKMQPLS